LIYDSIGRGIMGDAWNSDMVAAVITAAMGGTGEEAVGQAEVDRERGGQWLERVAANIRDAIIRRGVEAAGMPAAIWPPLTEDGLPTTSWPPLPEGVTWDDVRRRLLEAGRTGPLSSALVGPVRFEMRPVDAYIAQLLEVATPRNMPIQERINLLLDQLEQMGG